jgi:hypothetical protein
MNRSTADRSSTNSKRKNRANKSGQTVPCDGCGDLRLGSGVARDLVHRSSVRASNSAAVCN